MRYVGFWKRVLAYIIDMTPIFILVFGVSYFFLGFDEVIRLYFEGPQDHESRMAFLAERNKVRDGALLLWILYGLVMDCSKYQGTHGKLILGIKVTDECGNKIDLYTSSIRTLMKVTGAVPFFMGYLWVAFQEEKAGWHDLAAGTRVVQYKNQS